MDMKRLLTLAAVALALGACGEPGSLVPPSPDTVVLRVEDTGGFVPLESVVGHLPRFVLTSDGTLYLQGPQIEIYPGPLLPNIQTVHLDAASLNHILDLVRQAGLPDVTDERNVEATARVADATTTVITYQDKAGSHRFSVYALGILDVFSDPRVPRLATLVAALDEAGSRGAATGFRGSRLQVYAEVAGPPADPEFRTTLPWPLPIAFAEMGPAGQGWSCSVFEGDDASRLLDVFTQANQETVWTQAGTAYLFRPRPLLPGETGCERLGGDS